MKPSINNVHKIRKLFKKKKYRNGYAPYKRPYNRLKDKLQN